MQTSSRVMLNAVSSWVGTTVNAVVGLLLVPFLLGQFGRAGFGLVGLLGVIVALTAVADMGLRGSLGRQLAEQLALRNMLRFNELASSAMGMYLLIATALCSLCMAFATQISQAFNVSPELMVPATLLIRWYGALAILITFISAVYASVLTSHNRFDLLNYAQIATGLLRAGLILGFLMLSPLGLYGWALAMAISLLANLVLLQRLTRQICPGLRIRPSLLRKSGMRSLLSLGGYVFILQLTALLSVKSDPIVLTSLLGLSSLALYTPVVSLIGSVRPLVDTLTQQLHPLATDYHVTGKSSQLQSLLLRGTRYTLLMGIPVCVVFIAFAKPICFVWLGAKLGQDYLIVAHVLVLWVIADFFNYAAGSQYPALLGMGRLGFLVATQVPLSILNVLGAILLVKYTSLGVPGVVVPTVLDLGIRRPLQTVYAARKCGLPISEYLRGSYLRPLLVAAVLSAVAAALQVWVQPYSLKLLVICTAIMLAAWIVLCWFLGFDSHDRRSFGGILERFRSRLKQPSLVAQTGNLPASLPDTVQPLPLSSDAPDNIEASCPQQHGDTRT